MKRPIVRIALSASLLPAMVCLAALVLLNLPKTTSTTALARNSPAQSIEAVRDALQRAINDAHANPSEQHIAAVDAAFRNYLIVISAQERKLLNRINELQALSGMTDSTIGFDSRTDLQRSKSAVETDRLHAEYRELSAQLEYLRSDFGAANVEVNKVIGSRGQADISAATSICDSLIVREKHTTRATSEATQTLVGMITLTGGTVTVRRAVPASLDPYSVVYDIRFVTALTVSDMAVYLGFLQRGGKLLMAGERANRINRNNSVISFVNLVGGGQLMFCDPACLLSCGAICSDPLLCSVPPPPMNISLPGPGGTTTSGLGTPLLTMASGGCVAASIFRPGQLVNARPGTLITFFDVNTFQSRFGQGNDNLRLIGNIVAFFCMCSLNCPENLTVATNSCPLATGATVNYPAPSCPCNCGTIDCSPPPGFFPLGTTTVTCTAPRATSCSFTVTVFNGCLEDSSGNVALFNTQTGEYQLCCGGQRFTGRGVVTIKAFCLLEIQEITASRRLAIMLDGAAQKGTVFLESPPGTRRCTFLDEGTTNNSCKCQ